MARDGGGGRGDYLELSGNLIWGSGGLVIPSGTVLSHTIVFNYDGIIVSGSEPSTITANNIYGNGRALLGGPRDLLVLQPPTATVNVAGNWWGTTDITTIEQSIVDGKDDSRYAVADFLPIATAPIADAPRLYAAYFPWVKKEAGGW